MEAEGVAAIVVNSGDLCRGCLCFSQVNTGTNTQLLSRSLSEGTLSFFFILFFKSIELFCLSFHFRLGKTRRLVCIQLINLDLSLEGEGLICYVLKTLFDFPFFFHSEVGRNVCFVLLLSLTRRDTPTPCLSPLGNLSPL